VPASAVDAPAALWQRWIRSENRLLFALTLLVGILGGLAAVAFHLSIDVIDHRLLAAAIRQPIAARAAALILLLGASGAGVGLLLQYVFPYARGSGIPEVKYEYATGVGPRLSARTVAGKFLLGAVSIGSGFSLGREGPTVQICSGIGVFIGRIARIGPRAARGLVCIGAAAGIAAAFNTPIAAITFALEEIVGNLNQRLLGAIVVASVASAVVEHAILGGAPVFAVPPYSLGRWWELFAYAALGALSAVVATAFVKSLLWMRLAVRRWHGLPPWAKPAAGGLLVAALGIVAPSVLGIGYDTLSDALLGRYGFRTMTALTAAKLAATVVSYAWGLAGGIFAPTLYIGGMLGGAAGAALQRWLPSASNLVGSFALVGMGAVFAGAIRAPITSILIIFEMTGDYAIILPLMIANSISYALAARWQHVPIYDALLHQDGLHPEEHELAVFRRISVERAMTRTVVTARSSDSAEAALRRLDELAVNALPAVDADDRLVGIVSRKDLHRAADRATVGAVMSRHVATIFPDQTLEAALLKMGRHGVRQLPVVSRGDPHRLAGIVALRDIAGQARPPRTV